MGARVEVGKMMAVGTGATGARVLEGGRRVGVDATINGVAEGLLVAVGLGRARVGELVQVGDCVAGAVGLARLTGVPRGLRRVGV